MPYTDAVEYYRRRDNIAVASDENHGRMLRDQKWDSQAAADVAISLAATSKNTNLITCETP